MQLKFSFLSQVVLCLIVPFLSYGQNVKIKGKAHASHIGKPISLLAYSDLITYTKTREAIDTVDKDGYFELDLQIEHTQPVELQIENLFGKLYIQPNYVYGVTFPEKDKELDIRGDVEEQVLIGVISGDTTELNTLIIDYNKVYNKMFENAATEFLNKNRIYNKLDTVQLIASWRYKNIKNNYFKSYVQYSIAESNSNASRGKNFLASNFIAGKPVLHTHFEYMTFFNAFFKGYVEAYSSTKKSENIHHLINTVTQYTAVNSYLKSDPLLSNDTLRELVIIKSLWDYYYSPQFSRELVLAVIEQMTNDTKIKAHKKILNNILQIAYNLSVGMKAPDFVAYDRTGKMVTLGDYKGRYVYLNFFSTKSVNSLKEMPKMAELVKKYGDKVTFISICTDDSIKNYKNYLKANPKYTWPIWYNKAGNDGKTAYDVYNLKAVPAFFFINQFGNLAQSPATAPTQGFEYKLKALFKPKKKDTKIGIR